jgi:methylated-DNA-protein-cysteine methyltransferase-like protein
MSRRYERIYAVVIRIPKGKVATYGQIARLAGLPNQARQVGYALSALTRDDVPWQRVINAKGGISTRAESGYERLQQALLEAEGVEFGADGRISLARYQWKPKPDV